MCLRFPPLVTQPNGRHLPLSQALRLFPGLGTRCEGKSICSGNEGHAFAAAQGGGCPERPNSRRPGHIRWVGQMPAVMFAQLTSHTSMAA